MPQPSSRIRNNPQQRPLAMAANANEEFLGAAVAPATLNAETRTVDVAFFTGIDIQRFDYFKGEPYMLRFDPKGADLSMLNNGAPVLDAHNSFDTADQKGVVERAWRDGKEFKATLRFSKRPEVDGLWQDISDKIVQKFSMGVSLVEKKELAQEGDKLRVVEVTKWQPFEISTAPLAADMNTRTLSAAGNEFEEVRADSPQEATMDNPITQTGTQARTTEQVATLAAVDNTAQLEAARKAAQAAERSRVLDITTLGKKHNLMDLAEKHIEDGKTVEEFRAAALDAIATKAEAVDTRGHVSVIRDEAVTRRQLASDSIANLIDPANFKMDPANDFRGMRLSRMAEELLARSGVNVRGMSASDIAFMSMSNTADFPFILADSGRKLMLPAYEAADPTYRLWTKRNTTPDFKTMSRLRRSEAPEFLVIPEGAQIPIGTLSESREQYGLETVGRGLSFSRQMLINDDLGAFRDLVQGFGVQAAIYENNKVYGILIANANMSDSVALFHATHGNSGTGVIANAGLDSMVTAMATQTGLDGSTTLNIKPKFLIVPAAKATTAANSQVATGPSLAAASQNWFAGRFIVVADGALDGNSTAEWYGAADPSIYPGIEYSYLEGAEGPQMLRKENEQGILGIQLYAYLDFGAKAVDWRPLYFSTGA